MSTNKNNSSVSQQTIESLTLEEVMGERFSRYSKAIIQERALPDIRDGLKPVQRRILFAMNKDGNTFNKGFRKAAKSVGNVMGNLHPHGDSSIYDAMIRMSQSWKLREPLIDIHGNNGSMDGDPPAAMRYTEGRLSRISSEMLKDIDKGTVDWMWNFDDTEKEPVVLPARLPNLLINGATGISSGYATEIPPHNLTEVVNSLLYLQSHPAATVDDLMKFVKGPDFPTGGIIQGIKGIKEAYKTGHGKIVIRSKTEFEKTKGDKKTLLKISEIPYEVNKSQLVKQIDEIRINKKIDGINEVRDDSDREGLSIVVELKKEADKIGIFNYLLKNTDLQVAYNFNMVAINKLRPERLSLKTILKVYLEYQRGIIKKRAEFDLKKAKARQHIVEGLIKALSILDEVIKTVRNSKNKAAARNNLVKQFNFSEKQAEAIISLQIYRFTNTDINELEEENIKLNKEIDTHKGILNNPKVLDKVLSKELKQLSKEYPSERKSKIVANIEPLTLNKSLTIPKEQVMVLVSRDGYIKRSSLRSYSSSSEQGNGLKSGDQTVFQQELNTMNHLFLFTNKGNLIYRPVHELKDTKWKEAGEHLSQSISLNKDEKIISVYSFKDLNDLGNFLITTDEGQIKRTPFDKLKPGRTYKHRPITFEKFKDNNSKVVAVDYINKKDEDNTNVITISSDGYSLKYPIKDIPVSGGRSIGVKAMKLNDSKIVNAQVMNDNEKEYKIGMISSNGTFKKIKASDVSVSHRGLRGNKISMTSKNKHNYIKDFVVFANEDTDLVVSTNNNINHYFLPADYSLSNVSKKGKLVVNVDEQGEPNSLRINKKY